MHILCPHCRTPVEVVRAADGRRLASGSMDNTVKVWDVQLGVEALALKGHTNFVQCVAFSPDGRRLASGSADGTVRVHDAPRDLAEAQAMRRAVLAVKEGGPGK
jgi:WD40 repeat protein